MNLEKRIQARRGIKGLAKILLASAASAFLGLFGGCGDGGESNPNAPLVERLTNDSVRSAWPKVVANDMGIVHVLYETPTGIDADYGIMHLENDGTGWTSKSVSKDKTGDDNYVSAAIDSIGGVHAIWNNRTGDNELLYSYFNGTIWGAVYPLIHSHVNNNAYMEGSVAVNSSNMPHVAWREHNGSYFEVFYSKHDAAGWTAPEKISSSGFDVSWPSIAIDSDGNPFAAWQGFDGSKEQIYYTQHNGSIWLAPAIIPNPSSRNRKYFPKVAADNFGKVHLVCAEEVTAENYEIQYFTFDTLTSLWSSPEEVSQSGIWSYYPDIILDGDNKPYVVWQEQAEIGGNVNIYFSKRNSGVWELPRNVSTNSATSSIAVSTLNTYIAYVKGDLSDESTLEIMLETAEK